MRCRKGEVSRWIMEYASQIRIVDATGVMLRFCILYLIFVNVRASSELMKKTGTAGRDAPNLP